jgi:hypothetical protein
MRRWRAWNNSLLLLGAMCAVLAVSTAACDLCCVGHLPALPALDLSDVRPLVAPAWLISTEKSASSLDLPFSPALGRAPPPEPASGN